MLKSQAIEHEPVIQILSFAEAEGEKKKNFKRNLQTCCAVRPTGIHGGETISIMLLEILLKKDFNCLTKYSSFFHLLTLQPNQVPHTAGRCREIPQPEKIIHAGQRQKFTPGLELLSPRTLKTLIEAPKSFLKSPL